LPHIQVSRAAGAQEEDIEGKSEQDDAGGGAERAADAAEHVDGGKACECYHINPLA